MKVLHVSHGGLGNGGVSSVILSIVSNLYTSIDFGCVVFSRRLNRENIFLKYGKLHRINVYHRGNAINNFVEKLCRPTRLIVGVFRICRKERYDVIHCHNGFDAAFCLLGAKLAGVRRRIVHTHNPLVDNNSHARRLLLNMTNYLINRYATIRVGCSEHVCESAYKDDYRVIYNSIDLSSFVWHDNTNRDSIRFIHVGRFGEQKNQLFLIDIFREIHQLRKDSSLRIVGFGEKYEIEQKICQYGLENCISIIDGKTADISACFSDADYMIFPSTYEGFGIVLLEAQASGVYCFVSNVVPDVTNVGLWEKIDLSEGGKVWAKTIISRIEVGKFSTQAEVYDKLQRFNIRNIAQQYYNLYNEK